MTKKQFYKLYSQSNNVTIEAASDICKSVFDLLSQCLDDLEPNDKITLTGLGTFRKKVRAPRQIVGVGTGEQMAVPERCRITFTPSAVAMSDVGQQSAQCG